MMVQSFRALARPMLLGIAALTLLGAKAPPKVGDIAPPFELTMIDGSKLSLADMRGDVIVLNFWATWCVPCRKELPTLDAYYAAQKDHGLRIIAIATEDSLPLYQMKKLFDVLRVPSAKRIKGPFTTLGGVPTNYIIDRAGRIRYAKAAAFDLEDLNRELVPLLNEPRPQS